jgi:hypothetical protein
VPVSGGTSCCPFVVALFVLGVQVSSAEEYHCAEQGDIAMFFLVEFVFL